MSIELRGDIVVPGEAESVDDHRHERRDERDVRGASSRRIDALHRPQPEVLRSAVVPAEKLPIQ